jgi:predicted nucleic acid-binding protein
MSAADFFLDTNVLLYLVSGDTAKADHAEALLTRGGVISVQVLNEFASVAARRYGVKIANIREVLSVIRTVCAVRPLDVETHELGLELAERYRYSIYDSMIIAAALRAGCATLFSEDLQDGQRIETLTIQNPFVHK